MAYDPERKPGVSLTRQFGRYGDLKQAVAGAVLATLSPVRDRYLELSRDPERVRSVRRSAVNAQGGAAGVRSGSRSGPGGEGDDMAVGVEAVGHVVSPGSPGQCG